MTNNKKSSKGSTGIKALVMVGSLVATLGGWGILAAGQVGTAAAAAPVTQQAQNVSQFSPAANQPTLQQSSSSLTTSSNQVQVRPVTRTRSSR